MEPTLIAKHNSSLRDLRWFFTDILSVGIYYLKGKFNSTAILIAAFACN